MVIPFGHPISFYSERNEKNTCEIKSSSFTFKRNFLANKPTAFLKSEPKVGGCIPYKKNTAMS